MEPERRLEKPSPLPDTRQDLAAWVREAIPLPEHLQDLLIGAFDRVQSRQEQLWQASKDEAMRAMSQGFANQMAQLKQQLAAKDATVANISEYFERVVSNLKEQAGRDPKTNLLNFPRFQEALSLLLATERRGHRCAVGLIDIAHFKWYNDNCGHLVGDQIIEKVSTLLRQHMRDRDLVAKEPGKKDHSLHARFGGDEFCFLLSDVGDVDQVRAICRRFSNAVSSYDWATIDAKLGDRPVRVDVGVTCLQLGPLADRRFLAAQFANNLVEWGDQAMYRAKAAPQAEMPVVCLHIERGAIVETAPA
jgi:diguanylate cyclase (GGDEF)-like protein